MTTRKAIGAIKCPLCARQAELHRFEERSKLNPDAAAPKASYPAKVFIVCPPTTGYRGCGTILANAATAQERIKDLAGAGEEKPAAANPSPGAAAAPAPASSSTRPADKPKKSNSLFDW